MIESEMNARAVIVRDEHILLARLKDDESYTFLPGGKFNVGEYDVDSGSSERDLSIYDALSREVKEEAGLTGRIDDVLGIFSKVYTRSRAAAGADLHFVGFLYRVAPTGGTLRDEVGGSTDTCAWFAPDELRGLRIVGVARHAIELALPGAMLSGPLAGPIE